MSDHKNLLQQAISLDNLRFAWEEIAENNGIAGVDHMSIRLFRRNWEENLISLAKSVRTNVYKSMPLRIRKIPKRNRTEYRTLRIPTVTDRILQRAVFQIIQPIYEEIFHDTSYSYRPNRGLQNALQRIIMFREKGYQWLLDADIDDFFNQVNQPLLIKFLFDDLQDDSVLPLISSWISCQAPDTSTGIPMGAPISPLLANVYLHRLDGFCKDHHYHIIRYADDFIVLAANEKVARKIKTRIEECLSDLQLQYEPVKTYISSFNKGFTFLGIYFYNDSYRYTWKNKQITVENSDVDWLFGEYGPEYE